MMSVVVRDGATVTGVVFRGIRVGPGVEHLVEQVIGVRDPDAALGSIHDLAFDAITAPSFARPLGNWTWVRPVPARSSRPRRRGRGLHGADETHALDGLSFRDIVVNGRRIGDAKTARELANLTFGSGVRNVTFA